MKNTILLEQQPQEKERLSLSSILREKFLMSIEKNSFKSLALYVFEIILFCAALFLVLDLQAALTAYFQIFVSFDFLLIKVVAVYTLIRNRKGLLRFFLNKHKNHKSSIDGIPHKELLHFLFKTQGFKLNESMKAFGISRKNYDLIAKRLEKIGILKRGANNSRVLNDDLSRQEIAEKIMSSKSSKELSSLQIFKHGKRSCLNSEEIDHDLRDSFQIKNI